MSFFKVRLLTDQSAIDKRKQKNAHSETFSWRVLASESDDSISEQLD